MLLLYYVATIENVSKNSVFLRQKVPDLSGREARPSFAVAKVRPFFELANFFAFFLQKNRIFLLGDGYTLIYKRGLLTKILENSRK